MHACMRDNWIVDNKIAAENRRIKFVRQREKSFDHKQKQTDNSNVYVYVSVYSNSSFITKGTKCCNTLKNSMQQQQQQQQQQSI